MRGDDIREAIEVHTRASAPALHAGVAVALASARKRSEGFAHAKYPHLLPLTLRVALREHLEKESLPNGWEVGGDPRAMGQLLVVHPELAIEMRFLNERRRTYPGGVPVAGHNPARRARWAQESLDIPLPVPGQAAERLGLLLCWDFASPDNLDEFRLRVVHTSAVGTYGRAVPCDLIVDVESGGTIFSHLRFAGSDEDEDFFELDIAEEENGS